MIKAICTDIYINPHSKATADQYRMLAVGAMCSEQNAAYVNSIETGLSKERVDEILENWWDVRNKEEAIIKLHYLRDKGDNFYAEALNKCIDCEDETVIHEMLQATFSTAEDLATAINIITVFRKIYPQLIEKGIIKNLPEVKQLGFSAWDSCRLVFAARLCYEKEYITEHEAWEYINAAYKTSKENYNSWEEYANSYQIGRAIWLGEFDKKMNVLVGYLFENPKSPWVQLSW
ncbi:DUF1266 domain-containing protein [Dysgonomonas sp. 511]|uniref:DUF1266 domain-containing protein n=1 Tax=Dysgonomonas sp. 511 TaxID=2302930 RepID=UPI0013D53EF4|nr:DUF1266 domain-containing protein [Dysgonomonas sp. 511]